MIRCMICGKPRVSLIHTTYVSNSTCPPPPLNPAYCYGFCVNIIAPPVQYTGYPSIHDALTDLMRSRLVEREPPEEKPLEWAEVEQQLDAFMTTLNRRNT